MTSNQISQDPWTSIDGPGITKPQIKAFLTTLDPPRPSLAKRQTVRGFLITPRTRKGLGIQGTQGLVNPFQKNQEPAHEQITEDPLESLDICSISVEIRTINLWRYSSLGHPNSHRARVSLYDG